LLDLKLIDPMLTISKWFDSELAVDVFMGVLGGRFPYFSFETFSSEVHRLSIQGSMNLTVSWKLHFLDMVKLEFEYEFTPLLLDLGLDFYSTSYLGDNCIWGYYTYETLQFNTRLTKNIRKCSFDVKRQLSKANSLGELPMALLRIDRGFGCDYDEVWGRDVQHLKFLSGSLSDFIPGSLANLRNILN
jgi:hypothetical protein